LEPAKRKAGQRQWNDQKLVDLRRLDEANRHCCPGLIDACNTYEEALQKVLEEFGLEKESKRKINTHAGEILIEAKNLAHTVEKRNDARERYIKYVKLTLEEPFEIWRSEYSDESMRLQFIGAFRTKRQMLVVVSIFENKTLWNFMHCDAKALNKHRVGELIYKKEII